MKVIKVIVDELPKDLFCFECGFSFRNVDGDDACAAIQNFDNDEVGKIHAGKLRPDWCPLVTKSQALDWTIHEIEQEQSTYIDFMNRIKSEDE